jgi:phosphoribosylformylglycinamidine cyclo-ligase
MKAKAVALKSTRPITYKSAGVDIKAKAKAIWSARGAIEATWGNHVVGAFGGFGGLFRMPPGMRKPLLCSSTDGVGTKIAVAIAANRHDTVGQDLVNHCVNDILVQGARSLFLLDYIGTGRVKKDIVNAIISGFATACSDNGCALIGGETAEMPGTYRDDDYDLAATIVGVVEEDDVLPKKDVKPGDVLIGLPSTGLHTNGYTLARKALFEVGGHTVKSKPKELGGRTVGDALLAVHRSYGPLLLPLLPEGRIKAMAHITGGGFPDNIPRVLPEGVRAVVDATAWKPLPIFEMIRSLGNVPDDECYHVFNMGVGMVLVTAKKDAEPLLASLAAAGEKGAKVIGEIVKGPRSAVVRHGN